MDFLILFLKGISSVTIDWLLRWTGDWESWKMFRKLNGQERCWNLGFCSEDSTKCLQEVYSVPEIHFLLLSSYANLQWKWSTVQAEVNLQQRYWLQMVLKVCKKNNGLSHHISSANVSLTLKCSAVQRWFCRLITLLHSRCNAVILYLSGMNYCQQLKGLWV